MPGLPFECWKCRHNWTSRPRVPGQLPRRCPSRHCGSRKIWRVTNSNDEKEIVTGNEQYKQVNKCNLCEEGLPLVPLESPGGSGDLTHGREAGPSTPAPGR